MDNQYIKTTEETKKMYNLALNVSAFAYTVNLVFNIQSLASREYIFKSVLEYNTYADIFENVILDLIKSSFNTTKNDKLIIEYFSDVLNENVFKKDVNKKLKKLISMIMLITIAGHRYTDSEKPNMYEINSTLKVPFLDNEYIMKECDRMFPDPQIYEKN